MGVNKVWCIHFGMGRVHKAFRFALYEFNIYNEQKFSRGKGIVLLDKATREYSLSHFIFNATHPIAIRIP